MPPEMSYKEMAKRLIAMESKVDIGLGSDYTRTKQDHERTKAYIVTNGGGLEPDFTKWFKKIETDVFNRTKPLRYKIERAKNKKK